MKTKTILASLAICLTVISCKKTDDATPSATANALQQQTASNIAANDADGHYTFFNLKTNSIVALSDSASNKWDIAFRSTRILVNGGVSGPGKGGALVLAKGFDDVASAPESSTFLTDNASTLAIPTGSGNGWYTYDAATNIIHPIAGRTIALRTADGKYAKIEILNYYKDAPASPTTASVSRYYTFRFKYQSNGTVSLN